jgi:hypothetical protein
MFLDVDPILPYIHTVRSVVLGPYDAEKGPNSSSFLERTPSVFVWCGTLLRDRYFLRVANLARRTFQDAKSSSAASATQFLREKGFRRAENVLFLFLFVDCGHGRVHMGN